MASFASLTVSSAGFEFSVFFVHNILGFDRHVHNMGSGTNRKLAILK
jgi:hypothetical protein